jgi:hypothetical protein
MERTKKKENGKTPEFTKRDVFLAMAKFAFLLVVCVFFWISCFTFDTGDFPNPNVFPHNDSPQNWCGMTGSLVSYYFFHFLGQGTWVMLLFVTIYFFILVSGSATVGAWLRLSGMVILVAVSSAILSLVQLPGSVGMPEGSGAGSPMSRIFSSCALSPGCCTAG